MVFLISSQALVSGTLDISGQSKTQTVFRLKKEKTQNNPQTKISLMAFIVLRLKVWSVTACDVGD